MVDRWTEWGDDGVLWEVSGQREGQVEGKTGDGGESQWNQHALDPKSVSFSLSYVVILNMSTHK